MTNDTFEQEKLKDITIIRNAIFKDYTLSAKAKGVACQLLSLPPTWEYSVRGLVTLFDDGEASIRSALSELEEHGYLRREQLRDEGKFGKIKYVITDVLKREKPYVENPHAVNPQAENSVADNHAQLNTKEFNTNQSNTNKSNTKGIYESEFEYLWNMYPKKQGKDKAYKSYEKARLKGTTCEEVEQGILAYKEHIRRNRIEPQYIKMGSTYFSQKAWQDVYEVKEVLSGNPFMDMLRNGDY